MFLDFSGKDFFSLTLFLLPHVEASLSTHNKKKSQLLWNRSLFFPNCPLRREKLFSPRWIDLNILQMK